MERRGKGTGTIRRNRFDAIAIEHGWVACEHVCVNGTTPHRFSHSATPNSCWFGGFVHIENCEDCMTFALMD